MLKTRWLPLLLIAAVLPVAMLAFRGGDASVKGTRNVTAANEEERPVTVRPLLFRDGDAGDILVFDANADKPFAVLKREENNFLASTIRLLGGERLRLNPEARDAPFTLTLYNNGRLSFADPATGHAVEVSAFGHTNAQSFVRLLPANPRL